MYNHKQKSNVQLRKAQITWPQGRGGQPLRSAWLLNIRFFWTPSLSVSPNILYEYSHPNFISISPKALSLEKLPDWIVGVRVTKLIASFCKDQVLVWSNFLRLQGGRGGGGSLFKVCNFEFRLAPYSNCTHNANTHLRWWSCKTVTEWIDIYRFKITTLLDFVIY